MRYVAGEAAFAEVGELDRRPATVTIDDWSRCLRILVMGHRPPRLAGSDPASLALAVAQTLARIEAALPDAASLHLVSSLAEGADSIIADAALAMRWRLDVVLPPPREDFAFDSPAVPSATRTPAGSVPPMRFSNCRHAATGRELMSEPGG